MDAESASVAKLLAKIVQLCNHVVASEDFTLHPAASTQESIFYIPVRVNMYKKL